MLSDICHDDSIPLCHFVNFLNNRRTGKLPVIIFQRIFLLQLMDFLQPCIMVVLLDQRGQTAEYLTHITLDAAVNHNVFIDLCRIDVNMQNLCIICKTLCISNHAVAEADTDSNQQVTLRDSEV